MEQVDDGLYHGEAEHIYVLWLCYDLARAKDKDDVYWMVGTPEVGCARAWHQYCADTFTVGPEQSRLCSGFVCSHLYALDCVGSWVRAACTNTLHAPTPVHVHGL